LKPGNAYTPLLISIVFVAGFFLGGQQQDGFGWGALSGKKKLAAAKIGEVLNYVSREYVDKIDIDSLTEKTIQQLLDNLDPHSNYMTARESQMTAESIRGNFEGIGVEFNIIRDSIYVLRVIEKGPSEKAGILPGDRLIMADSLSLVGLSNEEVINYLRGPSQTRVKVKVRRPAVPEILSFDIIRGSVPIKSIEAAYMIAPETGYIKLNRFSSKSHDEFIAAARKLSSLGMKKMILDLRDNPGGVLGVAAKITDEFFEEGKLITYTSGQARGKQEYYSSAKGEFKNIELALLINEASASASEIVAGAIQDHDRGVLIGTRTFGKGLVQEQNEFRDGSALRLTIARYYTPSGRSIQKPYEKGMDKEQYMKDNLNPEYNDDVSGKHFKTAKGRTVFGGGGILPDIIVGPDSVEYTGFVTQVIYLGILNEFSIYQSERIRQELSAEGHFNPLFFNENYQIDDEMINDFKTFCRNNEIKPPVIKFNSETYKMLVKLLKIQIARNLFGAEGYFIVVNSNDKMCQKAVEVLSAKKRPDL
jgi:carboxyl-terminal processing protease